MDLHEYLNLVIKPSNIRIWIHQKDIGKLQKVLWEGHGNKLRVETSNNPKVKKFLEAIPRLMGLIKEIHQYVINDDIEDLKEQTDDPVTPLILTSKDINGLTPLHKAAGLGRYEIAKYIIDKCPFSLQIKDNEGRTPLHYAAALKDNGAMYDLLLSAGSEEGKLDNRQKSPGFYRNRPNDIDNKLLVYVPEAPRSANNSFPSNWDWDLLNVDVLKSSSSINSQSLTRSKIKEESTSKKASFDSDRKSIGETKSDKSSPTSKINSKANSKENSKENSKANSKVNSTQNSKANSKTNSVENSKTNSKESSKANSSKNSKANSNENSKENSKTNSKENSKANSKANSKVNSKESSKANSKINSIENSKENSKENSLRNSAEQKEDEINYDMEKYLNKAFDEEGIEDKKNSLTDEETLKNEVEQEFTEDSNNFGQNENNLLDESQENFLSDDNIENFDQYEDEIKPEDLEYAENEESDNDETENYDAIESKVTKIHYAAREGNLREIETTLDRPEYSTSTHDITPNAASIMHVAVLFGHENIVRFLGERYPETLHTDDADGRTPLHYAAVMPDEKMYNLLINLGAKKDKKDNYDYTPEYYKNNPSELSYNTLSNAYGGNMNENNSKEENTNADIYLVNENDAIQAIDDAIKDEIRPKSSRSEYDEDDRNSKHSERVIEGIVNEEVEALNNDGQDLNRDTDSEYDIKEMIENVNMEQLAALVLNGDGGKLIGQKSSNPELQAFLDNIPSYMGKIRRVHLAAREGNLRELQAALDRRKFAIARDRISPNGSTPLHVAVIFGNTNIVRYLAGRFPETVHMEDLNGRTPLHYAATINDNGHYYNLLLHLGANAKAQDNLGHMAEYYRNNSRELSHRSLLLDFGAEDQLETMLTDRVANDTFTSRRIVTKNDLIQALEKCYKILHDRRGSYTGSEISLNSGKTVSSSTPSIFGLTRNCSSILGRYLKKSIFEEIKLRETNWDHNLYDIIWPAVKKIPNEEDAKILAYYQEDLNGGVIIPDFSAYFAFKEFLFPFIKDLHCIDTNKDLPIEQNLNYNITTKNDIKINLDTSNKFILSSSVECTRNFRYTELPINLNLGTLEEVEQVLTTELLGIEMTKLLNDGDISIEKGTYYTLSEILDNNLNLRSTLEKLGLMIPIWTLPDKENLRLHGKHWPFGRGVFVNYKKDVAIWINVLDHLRVVTSAGEKKPGNIGKTYSKMSRLMGYLDNRFNFKFAKNLGFLTSRPNTIGHAMKLKCLVKFPALGKDVANLKNLCFVRGLAAIKNGNAPEIFLIFNLQSLGVTEFDTLIDYTNAMSNILELEKSYTLSNAMQLANMFMKMFKSKDKSDK